MRGLRIRSSGIDSLVNATASMPLLSWPLATPRPSPGLVWQSAAMRHRAKGPVEKQRVVCQSDSTEAAANVEPSSASEHASDAA